MQSSDHWVYLITATMVMTLDPPQKHSGFGDSDGKHVCNARVPFRISSCGNLGLGTRLFTDGYH